MTPNFSLLTFSGQNLTICSRTLYARTLRCRNLCYRTFIWGLLCRQILYCMIYHSRILTRRTFPAELFVATLFRVRRFRIRHFVFLFFFLQDIIVGIVTQGLFSTFLSIIFQWISRIFCWHIFLSWTCWRWFFYKKKFSFWTLWLRTLCCRILCLPKAFCLHFQILALLYKHTKLFSGSFDVRLFAPELSPKSFIHLNYTPSVFASSKILL